MTREDEEQGEHQGEKKALQQIAKGQRDIFEMMKSFGKSMIHRARPRTILLEGRGAKTYRQLTNFSDAERKECWIVEEASTSKIIVF